MTFRSAEKPSPFRPVAQICLLSSASLLALLVTATPASALSCIQDRVGEPVNCTANDVRITNFSNIVVTDDGCASVGDSVTFNATLTVVTTATQRYDIGLFIGTDGKQALVGDCRVRVLPNSPPPFQNYDGDSCGDTSSSSTVFLPVKNITVTCADANGDNKLDVANCTTWQQNVSQVCNGPSNVEPGTPSKCNCPEVPTDIDIFVPEPICTQETCDDGLFCNGQEICDPNVGCLPGTPPNCSDPHACTVDSCNEATNSCTHAPNNSVCSDGQFCNGAETCSPTQGCQAGAPPNCADAQGCTVDACNEATDSCTHNPNHSACSDGLFCNGAEVCSPTLGCQAGAPPNCGDAQACTTDACNEATDSCTHNPNHAACSDGQFCNGAEVCSPTQGCQAGTPPNCADAHACTTDSCNEATDSCVRSPNNALCSDGQFCNGAEVCSPTQGCQAGSPPNCADPHACTADACNEATDSCTHTPNNSLCNDNQFCNGVEVCTQNAGCQAGPAPNCADSQACTVDACNEATDSCTHAPNNAACSDGQFCNGNEVCSPTLGCQAGSPVVCSDSQACTVDSCNEATDSCVSTPNNQLCSDGQFCNGAEVCTAKNGCQAGTPPVCGDNVTCTVDSCNETLDRCDRVPNNTVCNDGDICTDDVCDPTLGCRSTNNTAPCNDQNPCTAGDSCLGGLCLPGGSVCGDGDIDENCNEECDPGDGEICNNGIDDDGDLLIDCADPDCLVSTTLNCDAECMVLPPCAPIRNDPAVLEMESGDEESRAAGWGRLQFHGRVVPYTDVDPVKEGLVVSLTNANGEIFTAEALPGDIKQIDNTRWKLNATIASSNEENGGIVKINIRKRRDNGEVGYGFRVTAVGNFSRATLARMTTQVYFADDVAYLTATWKKRFGNWTLMQRDYDR